MMNALKPFESAIMQKLLDGDDETLAILRKQAEIATVTKREETGVGMFVNFSVPEKVERVPGNRTFQFGDVVANIPGLTHGAGFLLFVKDGVLDFLEGYTYDEPWPERISTFELSYETPDQRDLKALHEV